MKVSVFTTSYNYSKYIAKTIESVLNQTYKDFEYIILDDGSTDNSIEIINEYAKKDSRIKVYTHENNQNLGLLTTIKTGISKCSGDYIVFVESDDTIESNYLEEKIKVLNKHPDSAVIYNQITPFGDEQRVFHCQKHLNNVKKLIGNGKFDYYELFAHNIIPTFSCVMVKKSVIESAPFNCDIPKCFDWYLWNYILQNYKVVFLDKPLTNFRLHTISLSCKKTTKPIYLELLKLSKPKYGFKLPYNLFKFYKQNQQIEKLLRPICRKFDRFVYNELYCEREIEIILEGCA